MKNYEKFRDSLICNKNDDIDNAAYEVICAVVTEENDLVKLGAVSTLLDVLMPEGQEAPTTADENIPVENAVNARELMAHLEEIVKAMGIEKPEKDEDVEWEMEYIAEVTMAVENEFNRKNIGSCHPFFMTDEDVDEDDENFDEDNDGILCCLSSDKCPHCPYNIKEG